MTNTIAGKTGQIVRKHKLEELSGEQQSKAIVNIKEYMTKA